MVKNSIYLNFDNFNITEVGDTVDLVRTQMAEAEFNLNDNPNELPDI